VKGHLVCRCCACDKEKGTKDSNEGWWVAMPRGRKHFALDYCPDCAPGLRVRSDEILSNPRALAGSRVIPVQWLRGMLYVLNRAGIARSSLRETLGWRFAEKAAQLIDFKGLPGALPCREVGFISSKETP
jgi:hypothetical protein